MSETAATPPRRRAKRRARPKKNVGRIILGHAANAGALALVGLAVLAVIVAYYAHDLPSRDNLWREGRPIRVTLLAADGSPMSVGGESMGAPARLAELPSHVPNAVLAVEDRNFRHHIGFNPISVARAIVVNATEGAVEQGGSTITQQLAKNLFLSPDRTLKRKVQELLLALWLEQRFTKDEILTLYLNRAYYGAGAYGVDAAARRYFDKPARDLTVGEAAVLAGLLKAPSRYAPTSNPDDAGARARLVLDAMVAAKLLSPEEGRKALAEPVYLSQPRFAAAPYFVDHALREAAELSQGYDADLIVETTFDPRVQQGVETGFAAGLALSPLEPGVEAAVVVVDRGGAVRALIGGTDYRKTQFNRAAQARRQPGSAFKPIIYLAGLEAGMTPDDLVEDAPITIGDWSPGNFKDRYHGTVTLTEALTYSLNSAAVRVQERAGRLRVRQVAHRLGLKGVKTEGPALSLGVDEVTALELADAYAALANNGFRSPAHTVVRILTADGQTIYERPQSLLEAAASPGAVAQLNLMLESVVSYGTGKKAQLSGYAAHGKTGTTQDSRDAWFAGHAGGLAGVVWIGRDNFLPMGDMLGGAAPAILWRETMQRALEAAEVPYDRARRDAAAEVFAPAGAERTRT
jgi:penicillin-binding protein 1A